MFFAILINLPRNNKYDFKDLFKVVKMHIAGRKGFN